MSATAVPTRQVVMAQARDENFPVASILLGRRQRSQLLAIYGVAPAAPAAPAPEDQP